MGRGRLDGPTSAGCQWPERHAKRARPGGFVMQEEVALVTGASSGIGEALARRIARDGRHLVLVARRADRLGALSRALEAEHGIRAHVVVQDLLQPGVAAALVDDLHARGLVVDWL